jgi:signal peptidase I
MAQSARLARRVAVVALRVSLALCVLLILVLAIGPVTGWYRTLAVLSGSMRPVMEPGDVIVATPIRNVDLKVGDVITYHVPTGDRHLITHRVVEIVEPGEYPVIRSQGDANDTVDQLARLKQPTVWKTRLVVPRLGYLLIWLRSPAMRVAGSVLAPLLLLAVWLLQIWRDPKSAPDDPQDREPDTADEATTAELTGATS